MNHARKHAFELGLYMSGATCPLGACRTAEEIAIFIRSAGAHCSRQRILQIEERGLRKLRHLKIIKQLK